MMATHVYATFGGVLGSSASSAKEIWQCGLKFAVTEVGTFPVLPEVPSESDQDDIAVAVQAAAQAMINNPSLFFPPHVKMTWVKAAAIGPDGKYIYNEPALLEFSPISGSSTTGTLHPYQVTRCISFGGLRVRGKASRGRMFLPGTSQPVTADNVAGSGTIVEGMLTFIESLSSVSLESRGGEDYSASPALFSGTTEQWQWITRVGSDDRLDTQRRRAEDTAGSINWQDVTP